MSEELDPNRFHVLGPEVKKRLTVVGLIVLFVVAPIFFIFYYNLAIHRPSQTDKEITFEIKSGQSTPEIAAGLAQKNAINSEFLFSLYVFINKLDRNIQAGVYTIKAGTSIVDLVGQFQHGTNDIKLTFVEGWRVEEFARLASSKLAKIDYYNFVDKSSEYEGYLFPDTYYFNKEVQEDVLLDVLKNNFNQKTKDILTSENLQKINLTKEEVMVLASIVEREVSKEEDRPIVAGILIARYKEGMKLDADATAQYASSQFRLCFISEPNGPCTPPLDKLTDFNWWPKELSSVDLAYDSPYNTRLNAGLPPTPICNPGISAIKAVINFQPSEYTYYMTDKDGVTHYAKTLEEHEANAAKYLQ